MKKLTIYPLLVVALLAVGLGACDREADQDLKDIIKQDLGYQPVIASFTLVSPAPAAVKPGTTCTFDLRYWSEGQIDQVRLLSRVGPTGAFSTVYEQGYTPAYSTISRTDSLRLNYTVPADATAGTRIRVEARVTNVDLADYPRTAAVDLVVAP
jgi:hypothetical protein